jgi:AcrR family transcriptional regulator
MREAEEVRRRPGGRNAETRERVLKAVRTALEKGDFEALELDELARLASVHRTTLYRRWTNREGLAADLLVDLTPIDTPVPSAGSLAANLRSTIERVARTTETSFVRGLLRLVASSTDERLIEAARNYWSSAIAAAARTIDDAQELGSVRPDLDPHTIIEIAIAPIYLRTLITHQPVDDALIDTIVRTIIDGIRLVESDS